MSYLLLWDENRSPRYSPGMINAAWKVMCMLISLWCIHLSHRSHLMNSVTFTVFSSNIKKLMYVNCFYLTPFRLYVILSTFSSKVPPLQSLNKQMFYYTTVLSHWGMLDVELVVCIRIMSMRLVVVVGELRWELGEDWWGSLMLDHCAFGLCVWCAIELMSYIKFTY